MNRCKDCSCWIEGYDEIASHVCQPNPVGLCEKNKLMLYGTDSCPYFESKKDEECD